MTQTFIDDCFASGHQATTDLQAIENNFAALKSAFSGATTPADTVAGMWWYDTTAHILKMRNEANNAWLSVWDLANNKPVLANIVVGDIPAAMKDAAAGTASLRTIGTSATAACAGNDSRLSDNRTPPDASVAQAKLKTSSGSVTHNASAGLAATLLTLPGGEYGFYPRTQIIDQLDRFTMANVQLHYQYDAGSHALACYVYCSTDGNYTGGDGIVVYQRYVTASGVDHWIFMLKNKADGRIMASYEAPDHPSANSEATHDEIPHPFASYNPALHDIILADNDILQKLKPHITRRRPLARLINEACLIDDAKSAIYRQRAINKINEFPDEPLGGKLITTMKTPQHVKMMIKSDIISLESFIVDKLPKNISYRKLYFDAKKVK